MWLGGVTVGSLLYHSELQEPPTNHNDLNTFPTLRESL